MKKITMISLISLLFVVTACTKQVPEESANKQIPVEKDAVDNNDSKQEKVQNSKTELDLSGQNLSKVPEYVFGLTDLKELDLSDNDLEGALPGEIRFLKNLVKLDVSKNNMTGIPAEIGQLEKLEFLNYASNGITGLPLELGNLKNLKEFDLSGNDFSTYDLELIKKDLPDLTVITD